MDQRKIEDYFLSTCVAANPYMCDVLHQRQFYPMFTICNSFSFHFFQMKQHIDLKLCKYFKHYSKSVEFSSEFFYMQRKYV
jgi:hypothetical protein